MVVTYIGGVEQGELSVRRKDTTCSARVGQSPGFPTARNAKSTSLRQIASRGEKKLPQNHHDDRSWLLLPNQMTNKVGSRHDNKNQDCDPDKASIALAGAIGSGRAASHTFAFRNSPLVARLATEPSGNIINARRFLWVPLWQGCRTGFTKFAEPILAGSPGDDAYIGYGGSKR